MKKTITLRKIIFSVCIALSMVSYTTLQAQAITENFDDITQLAGNGWEIKNVSVPVGTLDWFQNSPIALGGSFDAYNGAANSAIDAGYRSTGNTGTISNWLLTPNRTLRNGDVITFYSRKAAPDNIYADRLEVRMSTNGNSNSVGSGGTTGDFTTLLLSINPTLVLGVYPTTWTQYTITISDLPAPTSGRIGFRYFVTGGGNLGTNSDLVGIDAFEYTPYVCPTLTITPASLSDGTAGESYSTSLSQTGALGDPSYAITAGALPPGITLSASGSLSGTPTATGTFNSTTTVSDASGCSGSITYGITVVCPTNPISISIIPDICSNGSSVTLDAAFPAGGTYSGTGVSAGSFDPAAGTQTITYDYTDPYGCAYSQSSTITVNTAPSVSITPLADVCIESSDVTLSGSPTGGTFSGTDVNGNLFTPSSLGTPSITYSYTDANGCSGNSSTTITVNDLPGVTLSSFSSVCQNSSTVSLTGGSPAGGVYSGTNVSGTDFTPSTAGSSDITYSYTDANGCQASATTSITVSVCTDVSEKSFLSGISCFPNPGTGIVTVEFDQNDQADLFVQITDIQGKAVAKEEQRSHAGKYSHTFDLSSFFKGIYTIEIRAGIKTAYYKISVQ